VEVADGQRVRVAERTLCGLGGRPDADAGDGLPAPSCLGGIERGAALQGRRDPGARDDRPGASGVDPGAVEVPDGHGCPDLGRRRDTHPVSHRAGRRLAVLPQQPAPRVVGLPGHDPLLHDCRDDRLEDVPAARHPHRAGPPPGVAHPACGRVEVVGVVVAEQRRHRRERGLGPRSPGGRRHPVRGGREDPQGRHSIGGAGRAPDGAVGPDLEGRVERAAAVGKERGAHVDGPGEPEGPGRHERSGGCEHTPIVTRAARAGRARGR
jgi:hypothetical protein